MVHDRADVVSLSAQEEKDANFFLSVVDVQPWVPPSGPFCAMCHGTGKCYGLPCPDCQEASLLHDMNAMSGGYLGSAGYGAAQMPMVPIAQQVQMPVVHMATVQMNGAPLRQCSSNKFQNQQSSEDSGTDVKAPQRKSSSRHRRILKSMILRGVPFTATEGELIDFILACGVCREELATEKAVTVLPNKDGRPSGCVEIHLASKADFDSVRSRVHMQQLGSRYIEALCSLKRHRRKESRNTVQADEEHLSIDRLLSC